LMSSEGHRVVERRGALTADELALRRSFFGLSDADEVNLDRIRFSVREGLGGLIMGFYEHPLAQRGSSPRSGVALKLPELHGAQSSYLTTLGLYSATEQYAAERARIGLLHESAGFDRSWYLGAHARLFPAIVRLLMRHHEPERLAPVLVTLQRILAFDSHLVAEAYFGAHRRHLEGRVDELTESQRHIVAVSRRDSVTQIDTRAFLLNALEEEVVRSRGGLQDFSLLFIDVDHFKAVNDAYGHAVGDDVLRSIVLLVKRSLRPADIVGRYGGDEFLVGLLQADQDVAMRIADRVCASAASATTGHAPTLSVGCATLAPGDSLADLIRRADAAMYTAKATGRNRVCMDSVPRDGESIPHTERV
jgi:diguanylate cyclase (GGDEF)-like protein